MSNNDNTIVITIRNRNVTAPKALVLLFEKTVGCSLGDMAELYLAASLKISDTSDALRTMTDEEILSHIKPWIKAEFDMLGVNYEEI